MRADECSQIWLGVDVNVKTRQHTVQHGLDYRPELSEIFDCGMINLGEFQTGLEVVFLIAHGRSP